MWAGYARTYSRVNTIWSIVRRATDTILASTGHTYYSEPFWRSFCCLIVFVYVFGYICVYMCWFWIFMLSLVKFLLVLYSLLCFFLLSTSVGRRSVGRSSANIECTRNKCSNKIVKKNFFFFIKKRNIFSWFEVKKKIKKIPNY